MRLKPFELCAKCGVKAEAYFREYGHVNSDAVIKDCKVCQHERRLVDIENAIIRILEAQRLESIFPGRSR